MYLATIRRYEAVAGNKTIELDIPQRVTITGREDHFARAYEDVQIAIAAMRALDTAMGTAEGVIYDVMRITSRHV